MRKERERLKRNWKCGKEARGVMKSIKLQERNGRRHARRKREVRKRKRRHN